MKAPGSSEIDATLTPEEVEAFLRGVYDAEWDFAMEEMEMTTRILEFFDVYTILVNPEDYVWMARKETLEDALRYAKREAAYAKTRMQIVHQIDERQGRPEAIVDPDGTVHHNRD